MLRILSLIVVCTMASVRLATAEAVTIGPGAYTFPKIARLLSSDGRTIECPKSLANRAAFVRLKDRSWEQVKKLLSSGLDLEFKPSPDKPGHWEMTRDPKVAAREHGWQVRFASNMREAVLKELLAVPGFGKPYAEAKAEYDALVQTMRTAKEQQGDKSLAYNRALSDVRMAGFKAEPGNWLAAHILLGQMPSSLLDTIRSERIVRPVDLLQLDPTFSKALWAYGTHEKSMYEPLAATATVQAPPDMAVFTSVGISPISFSLVLNTVITGGGKSAFQGVAYFSGPIGNDWIFRGLEEAPNKSYRGIGGDSVAWIDAEHQANADFIASETARKEFTLNSDRPVISFSQLVEACCRELGREAVMELIPIRESFNHASASRAPRSQPGARCRLADVLTPQTVWTFRVADGVLTVKDQFAFLDRLQEYPMGAYLKLERVWSETVRGEARSPSPKLADLIDYARSVSPEMNARWSALWTDYRGITTRAMAHAHPLLLMLARLGPLQTKEMAKALERGGTYSISLNDLTARELAAFRASFRARAYPYRLSLSWHPSFPMILKQSKVQVERQSYQRDGADEQTGKYRSIKDESLLEVTVSLRAPEGTVADADAFNVLGNTAILGAIKLP
jgi:hypothetical protein